MKKKTDTNDTKSAENSEPVRKMLVATLSAKVIEALAPMISKTNEFIHSTYAFMHQIQTQLLGTYILPLEKGCLILVTDGYSFLAVYDKQGNATETMKVYLPDELLETATRKTQTLVNGDGESFEVYIEPQPERVFCNDICALVTPSVKNEKTYEGILGNWMLKDVGNIIYGDSYRLELADIKHLLGTVECSLNDDPQPIQNINLNLCILTPFADAANVLETTIKLEFRGEQKPIIIYSENGLMFGCVMPLNDGRHKSNIPKKQLLRYINEKPDESETTEKAT